MVCDKSVEDLVLSELASGNRCILDIEEKTGVPVSWIEMVCSQYGVSE